MDWQDWLAYKYTIFPPFFNLVDIPEWPCLQPKETLFLPSMHTPVPYPTLNLPHLHMIRVEKGSFLREGHEVTVSAFELSAFPVTQALWEAVMGEGSNPSFFEGPRRPVEQVSWFDAVAFCNRLNAQEQWPVCYFSDENCTRPYALKGELPNQGHVFYKPTPRAFRLPTEAEWEYAARGGPFQTGTEYAGSDRVKDVGWCSDNSGRETHTTGLLQPYRLGLYDMSGNVREWCWDWYGAYEPKKQNDPIGPKKGRIRVVRGGSWNLWGVGNLLVSSRLYPTHPFLPGNGFGFRLARHLTP